MSDSMPAKRTRALSSMVEEHRRVAPLSKFQIEADVQVVRRKEFVGLELLPQGTAQIYTCGHFWRAAREVATADLGTVASRSIFPLLVSDIRVDEQPAY